jgi:hypothetical protein
MRHWLIQHTQNLALRGAWVLSCFLIWIAAAAQAPRLTACFDTSVVETGMPIRLQLTVSNTELSPDTMDLSGLLPWVPDSNVLSSTGWLASNTPNIWTNTLTLIVFDSMQVGPLSDFMVQMPTGEALRITPDPNCPQTVMVLPTPAPTDMKDMADIKYIRQEPRWWSDYIWVLWLVGGAVVLIWLLRWLYQIFQRQKNKKVPVERVVTAHHRDIALRKLEALERERPWEHGQTTAYYASLTYILREYWQAQYRTSLLDKSTPEVINVIQRKYISLSLQDDLRDLLTWSDIIKFAKGQPLPAYHTDALKTAKDLILYNEL